MILLLWTFAMLGYNPVPQDTLLLEEVAVYAPELDRFSQGQKVQAWDSETLKEFQGRTLSDLLQERSPVFVRQYGAGMIASPSFRGTSAGHTAVFWNGIPINSPSLGQSDLSIVPIVAIDKASLQFGNAGALFGNEAIGGSVHLGSASSFSKGVHSSLSQQFGSFGKANTYLKGSFSNEKLSLSTKLYREFSKNNFTFKDLGQIGTPERKEDHAQVQQWGLVQDLAWNLKGNQQLKASVWFNQADREIQPVMGSTSHDQQEDQSLKAVLDYSIFGNGSVLQFKTGMVKDELIFNGGLSKTSQYFLGGDWDKAFSDKWTFKGGLRYTRVVAELSSYDKKDDRLEGYLSLKYQAKENLAFSTNFREVMYQGDLMPLTPSIGMDWGFWERGEHSLLLKTSIGKGFKIPTLNDRFWEPGGNPELLPEESWSGELGIDWKVEGDIQWQNGLTYYRMSVDNWIIWLPKGSVWTPENLKHVSNQGVEYQGSILGNISDWKWGLDWSYTFSRAVTTEGISENDPAIGKQLPYTPQHQANAKLRLGKGGISTYLSTYYVGQRAITADNPRLMDPYQLFDLGISFQNLRWGKVTLPISIQINNLFNTDYQVLYLRAMPGRSFQFNLSINL
ncbi:TonB-dependent receptor [Algoriphagus machipongonensis]|nr:TonB-dependent receptor [Algoriphagus machipongonensis]